MSWRALACLTVTFPLLEFVVVASVKSLASKRGVYVTLSSSLSPMGGSNPLTLMGRIEPLPQMGRIEPLTQMGRTEPGQARLSASGSLRVDY
jgi:hypothetical protein